MDHSIEKAWAKAQARFDEGWRPAKLLGSENVKLKKAEKKQWRGLGLSLAPADVSGFEVCASRSPECTKHCIFTSGRGRFEQVQFGRIFRTIWFFKDRPGFMARLVKEIDRNRDAAIRLNVFSDWIWERQVVETEAGRFRNIMEIFPDVQFYDYTKHFKRMFRPRPDNYHLTFSLHENNEHQAREVLAAGMNVAAVTETQLGSLFGYEMIDGDEHDLRFLDPSPRVVSLVPKGSLKTSVTREMVYDPKFESSLPLAV